MSAWNFEQSPSDEPLDEAGINLRAYFDAMPDEKMQQYRPEWSDENLMAWDDNFTDEGVLFLPCSESSEVDIDRYRRVLEQAIAYREVARGD
jgi:hypothetical protein